MCSSHDRSRRRVAVTSRGRVAELRNAARQTPWTPRPELAPPRRLGTICRFSNEISSAMLVISIQSKYRYQRCFRLLHGLLRPKACFIFASTLPPKTRSRNQLCQAQPIWYINTASIVITFPAKLFSCGDTRYRVRNCQYRYPLFVQSMFLLESYLLETGH